MTSRAAQLAFKAWYRRHQQALDDQAHHDPDSGIQLHIISAQFAVSISIWRMHLVLGPRTSHFLLFVRMASSTAPDLSLKNRVLLLLHSAFLFFPSHAAYHDCTVSATVVTTKALHCACCRELVMAGS
jgi:hypothetical protein